MAYQSHGRQAVYCALLLGSVLSSTTASATATNAVVHNASLSLAPQLMLAKDWQADLDPSAFLVSEKLDGVRAFWDGHSLRFRSGRPIAAPDWFVAALPATPLDGELWIGRGSFDKVSAAVRRSTPLDAEWRELRYMIFDLPGAAGKFDERSQRLRQLLAQAGVPWLHAIEQQPLADRVALLERLQQTADAGGEGLMLHRADALWLPGRSDALRKLKLLPDEDAKVIAHVPGKGRLTGRMGALLLQLPNGKRFALGTGFTDAQRLAPPPVGAVVTYRYRDRTASGLPRFASFIRVREED
jgi:DNA ligase-1